MKLKLWNIILTLILCFSCDTDRNLDGNYSVCNNGEYLEIYFKQDSMRVASNNERVKLSKWRKIEIINDTLYFETFGEWREKMKAKINYTGFNNIEMRFLETDERRNLEPINRNLNFGNEKEFWNGFNKRLNSKNCK